MIQLENLHTLTSRALMPRHHGSAVEDGDHGGGQLDPGLGASSSDMGRIAPVVARDTTVCV
jgi:hypothetical protein